VALKITTLTTEVTTVKLDGRLSSKEVIELTRLCDRLAAPVVIDLSGLFFADDEGVNVLADLKAHGVELVRPRPYLSVLLRDRIKGPPQSDT
jgi:anti-anti-sigma regulatory factor